MSEGPFRDLILLASPIAGLAADVVAQLVLFRVIGLDLMRSMTTGFLLGAVVTIMGYAAAVAAHTSWLDSAAFLIVVLTTYSAGAFCYFCFVNLGETSLRIRILQLVLDAPGGLPLSAILRVYNDSELIAVRLDRMERRNQARVENGVFYPQRSVLFLASAVLELLKRLLYGTA